MEHDEDCTCGLNLGHHLNANLLEQITVAETEIRQLERRNRGAVGALRAIRKGLYAYVHEEGIAELSAEEVYELADDAINAYGGQ
jgi:hypothetical protein